MNKVRSNNNNNMKEQTLICSFSGDLGPTYRFFMREELNNTRSGNFQKSDLNTYTWKFGKCDTPSERKEVYLYDMIVRLYEMMPSTAMLSQQCWYVSESTSVVL